MRDAGLGTVYGSGLRHNLAIDRDTVRLSACLTLPNGEPPFPCVVFAHGCGCRRESLAAAVLGRRLVEAGIGTLMFDLSGEGESTADRHQDDEAHVEDLESVFKWARSRPEIDSGRVAVLGCDIGALAAVRAVRRKLVRPETLVLVGPAVESCGFVGVAPPSLAIVGADDPSLSTIRTLVDWSDSVTLTVLPQAGPRLEEPHALEAAAELALDWLAVRLAGGWIREAEEIGGGD